MTSIVRELKENGALGIVVRTILENRIIYRGIVMHNNSIQITRDASTVEEIEFECSCRMRDLSKE